MSPAEKKARQQHILIEIEKVIRESTAEVRRHLADRHSYQWGKPVYFLLPPHSVDREKKNAAIKKMVGILRTQRWIQEMVLAGHATGHRPMWFFIHRDAAKKVMLS